MYIHASHDCTAGSLGGAAAAPPGLVERGRRAGGLDHRVGDLPHARGGRAARGRRAAVLPGLGAGRGGGAVRCPDLRRAGGGVSALGRDLRLPARSVRPARGLPVCVGRAAHHPSRRLRGDRDHRVRVHLADTRRGSYGPDARRGGAGGAAAGRDVHRDRRRGQLLRHPPGGSAAESEHRVQGGRPGRAGGARLCARGRRRGRWRAGPAQRRGHLPVPAGDGGDSLGL